MIRTNGIHYDSYTTAQRNALVLPGTGLTIYNSTILSLETNIGTPVSPNWYPNLNVESYANLGAFPLTGELGVVYIATDTNLIYRWTGLAYQAIGGTTVGTQYLGLWNATTNTPIITSSIHGGSIGDFYFVSPGGTTLVDGINTWDVGDAIIWNGTTWEKLQLSMTAGIGQKAQTMIFGGVSTEHISKSLNVTYEVWGTFKFEGSLIIGNPSAIRLILAKITSSVSPSWSIRIYDATNANVIAQVLNQPGNVAIPKTIFSMGPLSNIPTGPAMFEIQVLKTGGGQQQILLSSLTIEY